MTFVVLADAAIIGEGSPVDIVTAPYAGAIYRDKVTGNLWVATGVETADWVSIATGNLFVPPTSDPAIEGAVWNNAGTLAISAGP